MDTTVVVLLVLVAVLAGVCVGLAVRRGGAGRALEGRMSVLSADLDRRLAALDQRLWLGLDAVQHGQAETQSAAADVRERVAGVAGLAQQLLDHARGMSQLEDLLKPPQARGAFGEVLLEQLLSQGLPSGSWRAQHTFRTGARVDAVLDLGQALVPVDAKFPLDAFARMAEAGDEPARSGHRRAFTRDARRHLDAIADKYIRPDEGTFDFALCYVPSEAVYYEFLREEPGAEPLFRYAAARRVFPVSPTTFYAYLVSIGLGLRGLRVEANARRILEALQGLAGDLERLKADFETVGRHLGNARGRWDEAARRLDRFDWRLAEIAERAEDLDVAGGRRPALEVADQGGPSGDGLEVEIRGTG
jgi:DNA recombination protein RmuC